MKNRFLFLVAMTVLGFTSLRAQTEWVWQSPLPQGNSLNDVWTFDENAFIAVGVDGACIQTADGGLTWDILTPLNGRNEDFLSIFFLDDSTGWITGENGLLLRTEDRGGHWIEKDPGVTDDLMDLQFTDPEHGWIVGRWGTILRTSDGGTVWTREESGTYRNLRSVCFIDTLRGWTAGHGGTILKTENGGAVWRKLPSGVSANLWSVQFVNPDTGWAAGQDSTILKTVNGGVDWIPQTGGGWHFSSVHFSDPDSGLAVGFTGYLDDLGILQKQSGVILKTANGGGLWTSTGSGVLPALNAASVTGPGTGWVVGNTGAMLRTLDNGLTWESRSKGTSTTLNSVFFIDPDTGWALGAGQMLKTEDGGENWKALCDPLADEPRSPSFSMGQMQFLDGKTGFTTAGYFSQSAVNLEMIGTILQTTDGGATWIKRRRENFEYYFDVAMTTPDTGYALGAYVDFTAGAFKPRVMLTVNGGADWQPMAAKLPAIIFYSIDFIDAKTGWMSGETNTIYRTVDGGLTWKSYKTNVSGVSYQAVDFIDANNGWAVASNGIVVASTDGGLTWKRQDTGENEQMTSLFAVDRKTVWATGANGAVLNTLDGGLTWTRSSTGTSNAFLGVCFPTPSTGWVVGQNGSILKTVNGRTAVEGKPAERIVPDRMELSPNYPNPFNSATVIRFTLPRPAAVTLKLYDLLGKEVAVLTEGFRGAGRHEVPFDAGRLPSGVYFYRLDAGGQVETHKLVIQK